MAATVNLLAGAQARQASPAPETQIVGGTLYGQGMDVSGNSWVNQKLVLVQPKRSGGAPELEDRVASVTPPSGLRLGAEQLLRLARILTTEGWRVREIDLRNSFLEPLDDEEADAVSSWLLSSINSGDTFALTRAANALPYIISSVRLARGSNPSDLESTVFYRLGTVDTSAPRGGPDERDYLTGIVARAFSGG